MRYQLRFTPAPHNNGYNYWQVHFLLLPSVCALSMFDSETSSLLNGEKNLNASNCSSLTLFVFSSSCNSLWSSFQTAQCSGYSDCIFSMVVIVNYLSLFFVRFSFFFLCVPNLSQSLWSLIRSPSSFVFQCSLLIGQLQ